MSNILFPLIGVLSALFGMGLVARYNPFRRNRHEWEIFEEYETRLKPQLIKDLLKNYDSKDKMEVIHMSEALTFADYQTQTNETAIYPHKGETLGIAYTTLGLCGEAGEVSEKIKKVIRDKNGVFDETTKKEIAKEISDVLWYCAQTAQQLGVNLGDVAQVNLDKLRSRKERGVLGGSGDNR